MSSSELELSQSTVVSSSEEESIVMTSVIVPILIFFEESDGLILVEQLFGLALVLFALSQAHKQLLPIFVFLTPEKIGDSLVLPFTNLIVSAVCLTLEKLALTGTFANSTEAIDDTDGFLLEH